MSSRSTAQAMTPQLTAVDYDPFAISSELSRAVPTTAAQREVWLASELGRDGTLAYNESISIQLRGTLDVTALHAALQALTDRHEALRATFDAEGANMLIAGAIVLPFEFLDLAAADKNACAAQLDSLRTEAVETPFDLVNGPLIRTVLVRTAADAHELILTTHHIVCDGWSFGVISRDLMGLLKLLAAGRPASELAAADSFGDYAIAEHEAEHASANESDMEYWVGVFDKGQPVLDLPTDRQRGRQRSFASRRIDHMLPRELVDSSRRLGARHGVSLFATLFGVFAAMMERLGGEGDVVVGVPAAGQAARGLNSLVGHCINLLPVRIDVDRTEAVGHLLERAGARVLDAYDHQSCTFGQLLTKLNVQREPNRLPLVSVLFNIDTAIPTEELSTEGLTVSVGSNPRAFENFELFVNASQRDAGVVLECQYSSDLFDAATIDRWLRLYQSALERAVADPGRQLAELFSPTDIDLGKLVDFNASTRTYPREERIEQLISRQAALTPEATAVVCGSASLTYRDLDARSNAVARELLARGIVAGDLVGMACSRDVHMLTAMLGILKSGAAYVPLDPSFPEERLAYMCADAGLRCIVADRSAAYAGDGKIELVLADELARDGNPLPSIGDPLATAYVIYTSGSTGKPKGVVVQHQAVVNFLTSMARKPGITAADRLVAVTTTSFDIAVLELFLPLTVGAQTILADRDTVLDGPALRNLVEHSGATMLQATPAGWRLLVDAGWNGGVGFKALVGGEALPDDLAGQLVTRSGEVWNMYGPTETTVWSTCWLVPKARDGMIRIGHPIANTEVLVLDETMRPCPIGVPGEIFIGGDGVSIGYWQRPELTAERFVVLDGSRVYRTGDRGRWCNDGTLEHLGRLDFQVKVRGYRIELGEIEAALVDQPAIERAVVLAREDDPGDVRLVAYVVPLPGAKIDWEAIRASLRKTLPEYLVPAHLVTLPAIPLLPNGKIDRRSLPRPTFEPQATTERRAPSTATEAAVLQMMEEVLNLRGLGLEDDFFFSGGHSLLAARLTARLNKALDLSLPLRTVFEHATARALSAFIDACMDAPGRKASRISTQPNQSDGPLTIMQERIRFMEELHPGRVVYNTPSAHRLKGPFDIAAFRAALDSTVQRQSSLRTFIEVGPGGPRQRIVEHLSIDLPLEDLSLLDEATREQVLMQRMEAVIDRPVDIHSPPLFRVALYRLGPAEHVFLFMPHHMIWDGWSFDLLYEEMSAHYAAALEGRQAALPPLPVSYLDYANWHRDWLAGDDCRAQLDYWVQRFATIEPPRALPTDHQRRAGMTGEGRVEWVRIDHDLTENLRDLAIKNGVTLNMLVMAIYAAAIGQATSSSSLVVGVPVRGRLVTEVESLMGFFNNLLPIPLRVEPHLQIPDWLSVVKKELIDAFAHQDVPFERIATEREFERLSGRSGLYQTLYSFQDARERQRRWGPLEHSSVLVMQKGATEDFGFWLMEVPGGLEGGINYNADLFDASTARIFRNRILGLLRRVVEAPHKTLKELLAATGPDADAFAAWISEHASTKSTPAPTALAPRSQNETQPELMKGVAEIWSRLLGLDAEHIDTNDNFFDLGGTSILAMKALTAMERELGLPIEPRRIVSESLRQLAQPVAVQPEIDRATSAVAEPASKSAPADGTLSRVLGRIGWRK